ncbi:MAG: TldD/PmbA family protein [Candidatus Verstraetearchaeota archaeon]|nr:TldD/PmbA family protein [Candidatus Verstraetearchaeota archaeon]
MKDKLLGIGEGIIKEMRGRGADEAIVLPVHRERMMVRFSNNKVTVVQNWSLISADLLAVFGRRRLISRFEDISEGAFRNTIDRIVKEATLVPEAKEMAPLPAGRKFPDRLTKERIDPDGINNSVSLAINAAVREGVERVSGVFTADVVRCGLMGSNGAEGYDERFAYELNVRAFGGEASGQGLSCGTRMKGLRAEEAGGEAGRIVRYSRNHAEWTEGRYNVLFGPIIGANLIERVGNACSAFDVEAGYSCLAGKLGRRVVSENLTMVDDGPWDEGLGSRVFDAEGVPTKRTVLLDKGTLRTYLHNSVTARKFKTEGTGNAGWIEPSPWNLVVGEGILSFEEALRELGSGVYMVSNWYTRFQNYSTGDFSTICRDGTFLVEKGEIKGGLKGVRVSDNLLRMFGSVKAMGRERRWVRWWEVRVPTLLPAMIISDVALTKAQET